MIVHKWLGLYKQLKECTCMLLADTCDWLANGIADETTRLIGCRQRWKQKPVTFHYWPLQEQDIDITPVNYKEIAMEYNTVQHRNV